MERLLETDRDLTSDTCNPIKTGADEDAKDWTGKGINTQIHLQCLDEGRKRDSNSTNRFLRKSLELRKIWKIHLIKHDTDVLLLTPFGEKYRRVRKTTWSTGSSYLWLCVPAWMTENLHKLGPQEENTYVSDVDLFLFYWEWFIKTWDQNFMFKRETRIQVSFRTIHDINFNFKFSKFLFNKLT